MLEGIFDEVNFSLEEEVLPIVEEAEIVTTPLLEVETEVCVLGTGSMDVP